MKKDNLMEKISKDKMKYKSNVDLYETCNYDLFKNLRGNRRVIESHVERISKSIKASDLKIPIIVNEWGEVIDGQHTLEARRRLDSNVYFLVIPGLTIEHVILANSNAKQWSFVDYCESYFSRDFQEYVKLFKFYRSQKIKKSLKACALILGKQCDTTLDSIIKVGKFLVHDWEKAVEIGNGIDECLPKIKIEVRTKYLFLSALIKLYKHPQFEHKKFIRKLDLYGGGLYGQSSEFEYMSNLQEIYNKKNHNYIDFLANYQKKRLHKQVIEDEKKERNGEI